MIANLLTLVFLVSQPVAGTADPVEAGTPAPLNAAQQGALRCSAAFALVAERQSTRQWPSADASSSCAPARS